MNSVIDFISKISIETCQKFSTISQFIFAGFSLLIAILTYIIAIKIRKEFLRNQTLSKQMQVVNELIENLNDSKIEIQTKSFSNNGAYGSGWKIRYNVFEIGDLLHRNDISPFGDSINYNDFDDVFVLFDSSTNQIWEIKKLINNPFLPKSIGDELMNFYSSYSCIVESNLLKENEENIVILKSGIFEIGKTEDIEKVHDYIEGNALVLKSWLNLKTHSYNLTQTIMVWFNSKGVDDINLRIDYKN